MTSPNPRRSGNPATRAVAGGRPVQQDGVRGGSSRQATPPSTGHEHSRAVLLRLARLPRLTIPGLTLVLMLVGLAAPLVVAVPALVVVDVFVGWLAWLSWPILTPPARLLRCVLFGLVLGTAAARVMGWL